mgnify:CR=1 FL=1
MHKVKSFDVSAYIFQQRCGSDDTENQQIQIILEKNRGRKIDKTVVVQTKHSFQDSSKITQRFTAEQHPSEVNHDHGIQMAHKARKAGKLFQKEGVLHVDEQEEIQSPEIKFQLAPCQNPVSPQTINRLMVRLRAPFRLPPSGI